MDADGALEGRALFLLSPDNCLRRVVHKIVSNNKFEMVIIIVIVLSSIFLALDSPLEDPDSSFSNVLFYLDLVSTVIFTIEILLKFIAYGLIFNGKKSFVRDSWNLLDLSVVAISLATIVIKFSSTGDSSNVSSLNKLKILRMIRVLRPLRLIARNDGLKLAINSIIAAVP
mmetsp:Transcript_6501/g.5842  ORF Transcript_6501/g.5842 Transcript_6501/m.5842 type:complete len:171 (-) Transcript_6501:520-1032(-)|eukprot:CAMPEP_0114585090 /NCGR_PEP_ID=MMETSP0125-20121206/8742_1 /TAXON_ID=485358 ORGANISM="Aristerostoma sp., Strain ATCC 50986" /NCGR_SAMPLE_ID=MMETSP0125 /ASSEMBLY_ACC=CAM_ASM_000245 /LENGTH=170 /DNA_ID=CAMNT_0001780037 /DNA_START=202 /DNA_END=714 /DNA_ORIENTATION=+